LNITGNLLHLSQHELECSCSARGVPTSSGNITAFIPLQFIIFMHTLVYELLLFQLYNYYGKKFFSTKMPPLPKCRPKQLLCSLMPRAGPAYIHTRAHTRTHICTNTLSLLITEHWHTQPDTHVKKPRIKRKCVESKSLKSESKWKIRCTCNARVEFVRQTTC
jgi:hypothetical protein